MAGTDEEFERALKASSEEEEKYKEEEEKYKEDLDKAKKASLKKPELPEEIMVKKEQPLPGLVDCGTAQQNDCLLLCLILAMRINGRLTGDPDQPIPREMLNFSTWRNLKPKDAMATDETLHKASLKFKIAIYVHVLKKENGKLRYNHTEIYGEDKREVIHLSHVPSPGHFVYGSPVPPSEMNLIYC